MSDNDDGLPRLSEGMSAHQWRVLEFRSVLLGTVSALICLVFWFVAQSVNIVEPFKSLFNFLLACLVVGAFLRAVSIVGFTLARKREIDAGYTTLDGELLGLPQLDHRTGEVVREAQVQARGGAAD